MRYLGLLLATCVGAILATLVLTFWGYLLGSFGLHPESVTTSAFLAPLLAIFGISLVAASARKRRSGRKYSTIGFWGTGGMLLIWFVVWCYLVARWQPLAWWTEGLGGLSGHHLAEWSLLLLVSLLGTFFGGFIERMRLLTLGLCTFGVTLAILSMAMFASSRSWNSLASNPTTPALGMTIRSDWPRSDGTTVFLLTFDFAVNSDLKVHLYDADMDDASPFDDSNTSYMGQSIDLVSEKLDRKVKKSARTLLCAFNAGFFGAHGNRVAHHEAPVVIDGASHYAVDLIRPANQTCIFGVSSERRLREGAPRFRIISGMPFDQLSNEFETALAGVRPLRVAGSSVTLEPGIGSTSLRCSRTSIGWTEIPDKLFVLIVRDPDSEGASNWQRRSGTPQTGGWDVTDVQRFWESEHIPNAVLLDGGESTQLACRQDATRFFFLRSGYHVCLPLGHLHDRPLLAFPAMLPRLQNYRGVVNYLYVDDSARN